MRGRFNGTPVDVTRHHVMQTVSSHLLNLTQLAEASGKSRPTIYRMLQRGSIAPAATTLHGGKLFTPETADAVRAVYQPIPVKETP